MISDDLTACQYLKDSSETVKGSIALFVADNLAAHSIGGFLESFMIQQCKTSVQVLQLFLCQHTAELKREFMQSANG